MTNYKDKKNLKSGKSKSSWHLKITSINHGLRGGWKPQAVFTGISGAGYRALRKPPPALASRRSSHRTLGSVQTSELLTLLCKASRAAVWRNLIWLLESVITTSQAHSWGLEQRSASESGALLLSPAISLSINQVILVALTTAYLSLLCNRACFYYKRREM